MLKDCSVPETVRTVAETVFACVILCDCIAFLIDTELEATGTKLDPAPREPAGLDTGARL